MVSQVIMANVRCGMTSAVKHQEIDFRSAGIYSINLAAKCFGY